MKPMNIQESFEIDVEITDDDSRAEALREIARGLWILTRTARRVLYGEHLERAEAYWIGRLEEMLDRDAASGCDGIYGTIEDLEEELEE